MRILIVLFFCFCSFVNKAQSGIQTATFTVKGNCEECKARIENAADIKGVKILTWDDHTKVAKVTYNADKISLKQIQEAIAATGHEAGVVSGNTNAYKKLPKCCQYNDGKCADPKK